MLKIAAIICMMPVGLFAQDILSAEEFETYAQGKTLYFAQQGTPYGVEQYLPGQQSIWQYADGSCTKGIWFARKELICFVYENDTAEQCWHFLQKGERFAARAVGREPESDLNVIWRDEVPIACKAPDLGV